MTSRRITTASGIELHFDDRGEGDRPLVLVHGYTGSWQDFERQLPALAPVGRVITPDLRGHGASSRSPDPVDYTFEALTGDLLGLLDALEIARCDLLGHSMGGMLALRLALAHPERLGSLVLMATSASPLAWIDLEMLETAARIAREAGMEVLGQAMRTRAGQDPSRGEPDRRIEREWGEDAFWAWRTARIQAMDPEAYLPLGRAMLEQEAVASRLGEIDLPTLVMVGDQDEEFLAPSEELADGIRDSRSVKLPDAGHQPQHEAPEAWRGALLSHLARAAG
jgi:2-succinyl-6-hydroxy-2,4-cyclohexadiene-1-carboxylate synthase